MVYRLHRSGRFVMEKRALAASPLSSRLVPGQQLRGSRLEPGMGRRGQRRLDPARPPHRSGAALERACFDYLLLEDLLFVPGQLRRLDGVLSARALRAPKNDPLPLVPLLAQATTHLGIVPTISTSFYPAPSAGAVDRHPDLMSKGRVGCNFVTSTSERAAQNFGSRPILESTICATRWPEFVDP